MLVLNSAKRPQNIKFHVTWSTYPEPSGFSGLTAFGWKEEEEERKKKKGR